MRATAVCALAGALAPAGAGAAVPHTVVPGETLWSIAAASNLTTRALAAANGLSPDSQVVLGSTINVPSEAEAASALAGSAPGPIGAYTVQWGDNLSSIAARNGVNANQLAWMNGLDPARPLLAGSHLKLPTGAPGAQSSSQAAAQPATNSAIPGTAPVPTAERVAPSTVQGLAASHGVPASLATSVAHQESGFNNGLVSPANARGVMQILPGTWDWIQRSMASRPLNPASANENVHAGVLYLQQLLRDTGGDEAAATASYYQGLSSVRRVGMLPETQRYVANVMALRSRYGGP